MRETNLVCPECHDDGKLYTFNALVVHMKDKHNIRLEFVRRQMSVD